MTDFSLRIGSKSVPLLHARPEDIDLAGIEDRLKTIRRFSGCPKALTVWQHEHLVAQLARDDGADPDVISYALYHDHHEGVIGDVPGPLKRLIAEYTGILRLIETSLDEAILAVVNVPFPVWHVRGEVGRYDRLAETLEWHYVLGYPLAPWCVPLDPSKLYRYQNNLTYAQGLK